jgi:hypothetical protein
MYCNIVRIIKIKKFKYGPCWALWTTVLYQALKNYSRYIFKHWYDLILRLLYNTQVKNNISVPFWADLWSWWEYTFSDWMHFKFRAKQSGINTFLGSYGFLNSNNMWQKALINLLFFLSLFSFEWWMQSYGNINIGRNANLYKDCSWHSRLKCPVWYDVTWLGIPDVPILAGQYRFWELCSVSRLDLWWDNIFVQLFETWITLTIRNQVFSALVALEF